MEFSFGSLELNRTNPAHLGTKPLSDVFTSSEVSSAESKKTAGSFETYLLQAVEQMNGQQTQVSKMQEQIITDPDSVDIHDVTIAMAKAQMSLNLAQTVIDRVISGWNELSQSR